MRQLIVLVVAVISSINCQTYPSCDTFVRWLDSNPSDEPILTPKPGVNVQTSCETQCQYQQSCLGYIFENDLRRCTFYMGTDQSRPVAFNEKDCGTEPKSGEGGVRRSAGLTTNEDSRPKLPYSTFVTDNTCEERCGDIPSVKFALHNGRNNKIGSEVYYECMFGTLEGNSTITCNPDGKWDKAPSCKIQRRRG